MFADVLVLVSSLTTNIVLSTVHTVVPEHPGNVVLLHCLIALPEDRDVSAGLPPPPDLGHHLRLTLSPPPGKILTEEDVKS